MAAQWSLPLIAQVCCLKTASIRSCSYYSIPFLHSPNTLPFLKYFTFITISELLHPPFIEGQKLCCSVFFLNLSEDNCIYSDDKMTIESHCLHVENQENLSHWREETLLTFYTVFYLQILPLFLFCAIPHKEHPFLSPYPTNHPPTVSSL